LNSVLYTVTRWWLSVLPVNDAGQRAFEETLADWRKEGAMAGGPLAGTVVAVRAVASVLRSVAGVTVSEIRLLPQSGVPLRLVFWMAGLLTVVPLISGGALTVTGGVESPGYAYVGRVVSFLPVALFLAAAVGRERRSSCS
jgi:hypothetical protein